VCEVYKDAHLVSYSHEHGDIRRTHAESSAIASLHVRLSTCNTQSRRENSCDPDRSMQLFFNEGLQVAETTSCGTTEEKLLYAKTSA
jgi:hypothetical protein